MNHKKTIRTKSGQELQIKASAFEEGLAQIFLNVGTYLKSLPARKDEPHQFAPLKISLEQIGMKEAA